MSAETGRAGVWMDSPIGSRDRLSALPGANEELLTPTDSRILARGRGSKVPGPFFSGSRPAARGPLCSTVLPTTRPGSLLVSLPTRDGVRCFPPPNPSIHLADVITSWRCLLRRAYVPLAFQVSDHFAIVEGCCSDSIPSTMSNTTTFRETASSSKATHLCLEIPGES